MPFSALSCFSRLRTLMVASLSSAAVDSSARTSRGRLARARAIATRWRDRAKANAAFVEPVGRPNCSSSSRARRRTSRELSQPSWRAILTFSVAVSALNKLCIWKMKSISRRIRTKSCELRCDRSWPRTSTGPAAWTATRRSRSARSSCPIPMGRSLPRADRAVSRSKCQTAPGCARRPGRRRN